MRVLIVLLLFPFCLRPQSDGDVVKRLKDKKDALGLLNKETAREFIDTLRTCALNGTNFGLMAAMFSEDPGSAKMKGELEAFGRGKMVPEFEDVAFQLKAGEISEIFETKYGYHIIQLMAREGDMIKASHILIGFK